ncbi:hypothetical protein E8E15_004143 [Penicillium rubens]|uniref:CFEM domain-containing protein n=1 Tax=Penicillium rubens (strain ATCC 28089 / DSM 1075 / NRRL 1951 / Wisconsin 54-1255) TaxID=500485 RepID=B6HSY2_PENRW|nr:uncharacterized protein N7525_004209 [Penicillium rubens]CAP99457.1 hypothetical protein PCH_Pc22g21690 [Penicillium rubens Wisconsin 54-1255]KAF3013155.1 hypothetical protein E8E15_004143 [Penicillium rubens]KAJ5044993.1 hypothetical protein NUH16_001805 [Penicillium rubens]KAJ5839021.1 hypothetical protein N7525_004209 [Penicillium rubens]KAJ5867075.1 hypothetical protein N7534_001628 [Penicillium rubens]
MRFSSLAVLSLASAAVAADLKTWNDVVGDVPSCIKTCLDTFYSSAGLEDKCGSPDSADVTCVCGMSGSASDYQDDATKLSSCIQDKCETSELADAVSSLKGFMERFQSLEGECEGSSSSSSSSGSKKGSSDSESESETSSESESDSESNGAGSLVPGFNAMIASGALLLVGAAL